ncbi:hypothetical protein EDB89DRAFT_1946258 [Lactarius sanguifluus]|nr:hypothetical protein EDB89DRAFT_1946258 [Lactarius sanguifluus]
MLFLFIQHTSTALTVNKNYDRDVRRDMDMALDNIVPENLNWRHTDEGPDDSCGSLFFLSGDRSENDSCPSGFRTQRPHWSGHPYPSRSQGAG